MRFCSIQLQNLTQISNAGVMWLNFISHAENWSNECQRRRHKLTVHGGVFVGRVHHRERPRQPLRQRPRRPQIVLGPATTRHAIANATPLPLPPRLKNASIFPPFLSPPILEKSLPVPEPFPLKKVQLKIILVEE